MLSLPGISERGKKVIRYGVITMGASIVGLIIFNAIQRDWMTVCTLTASLVFGMLVGQFLRRRLDEE